MNPPAAISRSAPRPAPAAGAVFGGIWRLTARRLISPRHLLTVAGLLALLAVLAVAATARTSDADRLAAWAAGFHACFLVPVLAFVSAAGAMRDDLRADAVDYVFTRPVRRPVYLFFRYLAHTACAQLEFLPALGVLAGVAVWRGDDAFAAALPLLLLAQVLAIVVYGALGFLCGLLTSRYVIVGLVYGGAIEVGLGNVPTQLGWLSLVRHLRGLLDPLLLRAGETAPGHLGAAGAFALLLAAAAALLAVAAALFARREFAGSGAREA